MWLALCRGAAAPWRTGGTARACGGQATWSRYYLTSFLASPTLDASWRQMEYCWKTFLIILGVMVRKRSLLRRQHNARLLIPAVFWWISLCWRRSEDQSLNSLVRELSMRSSFRVWGEGSWVCNLAEQPPATQSSWEGETSCFPWCCSANAGGFLLTHH